MLSTVTILLSSSACNFSTSIPLEQDCILLREYSPADASSLGKGSIYTELSSSIYGLTQSQAQITLSASGLMIQQRCLNHRHCNTEAVSLCKKKKIKKLVGGGCYLIIM